MILESIKISGISEVSCFKYCNSKFMTVFLELTMLCVVSILWRMFFESILSACINIKEEKLRSVIAICAKECNMCKKNKTDCNHVLLNCKVALAFWIVLVALFHVLFGSVIDSFTWPIQKRKVICAKK